MEGQTFPECPVGGASSRCCEQALAPSVWFTESLRCWALPETGPVYGCGPIRESCCMFGHRACFGPGFSLGRCCIGSTASTVAADLAEERATWGSLGQSYHAQCRGQPHDPFGVLCIPQWSSTRYYKLLGHVLYCGPKVNAFAYNLLMMIGLHYAVSVHVPPKEAEQDNAMLLSACFQFYDRRLRAKNFRALKGSVVLISPLLKDFKVLFEGIGLHSLANLMQSDPRAKVVGLPTMSNATWTWPILRLRHAYWKLGAARYPVGYRAWADPTGGDISHCFGGDTTSGTRVYNASALRVLLKGTVQGAPWSSLGSAWMVGLDMELKRAGGTALTCLTSGATLLQEESYLRFTALERSFAKAYNIEAARFHPNGPVQLRCIREGTELDAISANVARMVAPYCIRLALKHAMRRFKEVWEAFGAGRATLLPVFGSALSLLRLGGTTGEVMPWDHDADLMARNGLSMKEFRERLQAGGFTVEKGESDSPLPGTMHWHVHYSDPDLDGITAYIDLFVEPTGVPDVNEVLPRAAFQLHSLPMTVTSETLYWIRPCVPLFNTYRSFALGPPHLSKVEEYSCPGHNACLPQGHVDSDGFLDGGMPDGFAKLDVWE
ncbi:Uncharacterized protein SCF082_LOCUS40695 [Durusdinium trenchii]|uniref:Uncharacterized protein n=1 Tax=Durusdinium trenchii TaxID=1381693 RepID=A0ABP0QCJ1_9DINO